MRLFYLSSTSSRQTLHTGYSMFKSTKIARDYLGVSNHSTTIDVSVQPSCTLFGLLTENNVQHLTQFDNAYTLESLTNFKTTKHSHMVEGNNVVDLECSFDNKEYLDKLYCQYRAFFNQHISNNPTRSN